MKKLILIDGFSLLYRSFYAVKLFTTSDGTPTNAVFGFAKLLLKIIKDEKPDYIAVPFDVSHPTFRHKEFAEYKGTRKPMPDEMRVQVPMLKNLLSDMGICMVEAPGFEADDIIGTLADKFDGVHTYIYTGDRDSFQLVSEHTSVCMTKHGVSELDVMTAENFFEKTGLTPKQIIDEKALMGDKSDNIPGIAGIGEKTALELLQKYGCIENLYEHTDELKGAQKIKIENGKKSAELSKRLATIERNVPLTVSLEDMAYTFPLSEKARESFARLEFRSFLSDETLFENVVTKEEDTFETIQNFPVSDLLKKIDGAKEVFLCTYPLHLFIEGVEYAYTYKEDLFGEGLFESDIDDILRKVCSGNVQVFVIDKKAFLHDMKAKNIEIKCKIDDVGLLRYLSDSNAKPTTEKELCTQYGFGTNCFAYALKKTCDRSKQKISELEFELYKTLELPLVDVLFEMEEEGVAVDESCFDEFNRKYDEELGKLSEEIVHLAGENFNLNSPLQLSNILFNKLGLPTNGAKKNAKGVYSTGAEVLEGLIEEHPIIKFILRYRELSKLKSTYIEGIKPLVKNGVVHTTYNQTVASTGRLSSANPNLQNIPIRTQEGRELRKMFVAREGHLLIDADYSQIELRLLAHYSESSLLLEAYKQGKDIHASTASQIFGVPIEKVTKEQRSRIKSVNFGIIYGMSEFGLAKDLGISRKEAGEYIKTYFEKYPEVKAYMERCKETAKAEGGVTTILGRRRDIPELKSSNYAIRSFGERAAMNMPLQGSSADIIKIAMNHVFDRLKREGLKTKLIMQVHDELILDSPVNEVERATLILKEEMENAVQLKVPLTVEVSTGRTWYDAK